jgi:hypothetical protein
MLFGIMSSSEEGEESPASHGATQEDEVKKRVIHILPPAWMRQALDDLAPRSIKTLVRAIIKEAMEEYEQDQDQ